MHRLLLHFVPAKNRRVSLIFQTSQRPTPRSVHEVPGQGARSHKVDLDGKRRLLVRKGSIYGSLKRATEANRVLYAAYLVPKELSYLEGR